MSPQGLWGSKGLLPVVHCWCCWLCKIGYQIEVVLNIEWFIMKCLECASYALFWQGIETICEQFPPPLISVYSMKLRIPSRISHQLPELNEARTSYQPVMMTVPFKGYLLESSLLTMAI